MTQQWVEFGRIGAPYGVRGWMHVQSYADPPEGLLDYKVWALMLHGEPVDYRLVEGRPHGDGLVVQLAGVEDREAAARLRGRTVAVRRSELPPPRERQYYQADLVGCEVRNLEGVELGRIAYFVEGAAGALMVVRGQVERWIPAMPRFLHKVDLEARSVRVDWPAELD